MYSVLVSQSNIFAKCIITATLSSVSGGMRREFLRNVFNNVFARNLITAALSSGSGVIRREFLRNVFNKSFCQELIVLSSASTGKSLISG